MISLIVARNDDKIFQEYLDKSLEPFRQRNIDFQIYGIHNTQELNSMYSKYNTGIALANPADDDILVFVHEDVRIVDENFFHKLSLVFEKRKDVGVVGIVGTKELDINGWWINDRKHHVGHWIQGYDDGSQREMIRKIGYDENMLVVDGCCFAVRGKVAKQIPFMATLFSGYFHFYDYSYCISVLEAGWKVAVADILIYHKSEGGLPANWHEAKNIFHKHYVTKGYRFPITKEQIRTI